MEVIEFSNETKVDRVVAPWEKFMSEGDFVSYAPSYVGDKYLDSFSELTFECSEFGDITYYLFTPDKNKYGLDKKYPLLVFIHGATNALAGKMCISHSGAEMFASPKYQDQMGGAYILVPLANEKEDSKGNLIDSWTKGYVPYLNEIILKTKANEPSISKVAFGGGSSGGSMTWEFLKVFPDTIDVAFPVSGFPNGFTSCLNKGKKMLVACAKYDEFGVFDRISESDMKLLESDPDVICYFPEFLRNGDKGVASLNFGIEIGQHCMITQLQANFIYDDGTPYIPELPNGMTGWFKEVLG